MPLDHLYTRDNPGEAAYARGYEYQGITAYVYPTARPGTVPLYRWYSIATGDHLYTISTTEPRRTSRYISQGTAAHVFPSASAGTVPLYRWYKVATGDHFYTLHAYGEGRAKRGYVPEGIACHVFASQVTGTVPFHRWFQSGFMQNYTFSSAISDQRRLTLLRLHALGHYRCRTCGSLSAEEREAALAAYAKAIVHAVDTDPNNNASAIVGGRNIWVNFSNLFPLGDQEIAQTLIHEVMHLAGYSHPTRRDPPLSNPDVPGDGGPYYSSPPLRAELCIAGVQSDAGRTTLWVQRMNDRVEGVPVKPGR